MSEHVDIDHVRLLIDQSGFTYQEIADGSGVSTTTISRIMRGDGAQTGTVSQLLAFLTPSVPPPPEAPAPDAPPSDCISREVLAVVLHQHQEQVAMLKKLARQRLRWIIILAVALVAVVAWFLWDLTHPEVVLIRLKQAGYLGRILLGKN